jgi:hypothetical protein
MALPPKLVNEIGTAQQRRWAHQPELPEQLSISRGWRNNRLIYPVIKARTLIKHPAPVTGLAQP